TQVGYFGYARGGIDYFIDNRNTITVNGTIVRGHFAPATLSDIDSFYNSTLYKYDNRISNTTANFHNYGGQLSYKHNFPQNGRELTADATYNHGNNDNTNLINTYDYFMPQKDLNYIYAQKQNILGS